MAVLARMHRQRQVNRASWKVRFTKQRVIRRGSAGVATATIPTLASITPATATAAGTALTVTCTGTQFISGITKITMGGIDQLTTFVSATSLTFVLARPTTVGTRSINVRTGSKFSTTPRTLTLT